MTDSTNTPEQIKRIYIRLPNWVGDVVMAEPCLRAIRQSYPDAHITVHGKKHTFAFLAPKQLYDESIPLQRTKGLLWPFREGKRLRTTLDPFDVAIILPNSLSSALIAWSLGAKSRIGYKLNGRSLLLTQGLKAHKVGRLRPTPMVSYYLKLAASAGANIDEIKECPVLASSTAAEAKVEEYWQHHQLNGKSVWAVNIGGAWPSKRYPVEHSADLCRQAINEGHKVLLLAGPDEKDMAQAVTEQFEPGIIIGAPDTIFPLDELVALLQRCDILISTDSGPRHFGVAAQIPTLALIGSTHPAYTGVDFAASAIACLEVDCWPCHKKHCPLKAEEHHKCLKGMDADFVMQKARQLLATSV